VTICHAMFDCGPPLLRRPETANVPLNALIGAVISRFLLPLPESAPVRPDRPAPDAAHRRSTARRR
jgi:hypothetical protein